MIQINYTSAVLSYFISGWIWHLWNTADVALRILLLCKSFEELVSSFWMKWTAYSVLYGCIPWTGHTMLTTLERASCKESDAEWTKTLI